MTLWCLLFAAAACSTDAIPTAPSGPEQNRLVATVSIRPSDLVIAPDETFQLSAVVKGARGQVVNGRTVTWSSSDESVIRIDVSGNIFAGREGTATLRANVEGVVGVATADVRGEVIRIEVEGPSGAFSEGDRRQLAGTYIYRNGARRPAGILRWSSSDPRALLVDGDGLAWGRLPGVIEVIGYGRGKAGELVLQVEESDESTIETSTSELTLEVGQSVQLWAEVLNEDGDRLSRPVKWSSSDPSVATVDDEGLVTGVSVGNATVTAKSGPATSDVAVTVVESSGTDGGTSDGGTSDDGSTDTSTSSVSSLPGTVTDLATDAAKTTYNSVTLYFTQVDDGTGSPADYVVRYLDGSIEGQWSEAADVTKGTCSAPLLGTSIGSQLSCTVDGLQASTAYEFQLVAFRGTLGEDAVYGELSNVAGETTDEAPLVVDVVPSAFEVEEEETKQLSATVTDVYGDPVDASVTWSTSASSVATVNSSGLVTAEAAGSATITAAAEDASDTSDATVTSTSTSDDGSTDDGGSTSGSAWHTQTWEKYSSTEDFRSNASSDGLTELLGIDNIHVDFNNPAPGLTRSLRYDYVNQGINAIHVGVGVPLPSWVGEVWAEVWFRLSDNYLPCNASKDPCDHKLVFLQFARDGDGRAEFHLTGGGQGCCDESVLRHFVATGWSGAGTQKWRMIEPVLSSLKDGGWHRVRLYGRVSSSPGVEDGALKVWVDDVLRADIRDAITTQSDQRYRAILVGRNKDKGLDSGTESVWIGPVRAWNQNPGW